MQRCNDSKTFHELALISGSQVIAWGHAAFEFPTDESRTLAISSRYRTNLFIYSGRAR